MTLPKLDVPSFEAILPSTNKKVKYRPFLVKEHKTLLMMVDSNEEEISRVVREIVDVCTFNKLNMNSLPSFDVEFLFCKIRAKSIGERIDLAMTCRNCEHKTLFKVDINELKVEKNPSHEIKFKINDTVGIEMKYPPFAINLYELIKEGTEKYFEEIERCVKAIYTTDGKYYEIGPDEKEDLKTFLSSMTSEQFAKVEEFFLTIPKLSHEEMVTCESCNAINRVVVEGISNFFV